MWSNLGRRSVLEPAGRLAFVIDSDSVLALYGTRLLPSVIILKDFLDGLTNSRTICRFGVEFFGVIGKTRPGFSSPIEGVD